MPISKKSKKQHKGSRRNTQHAQFKGYTYADEFLASPITPMPKETLDHYLLTIYEAMDEMQSEMSVQSWNRLLQLVHLMETMTIIELCKDTDDLISDAVKAVAEAGRAYLRDRKIMFTLEQAETMRAIANDFAEIAKTISHREMVRCHRITEARIQAHRKNKNHDIVSVKTTEQEFPYART